MATKVRQSDVAKAKLLDATIVMLAERGLLGFSLADVGERAGVSRGLAGYHFTTRQALLLAALASLGDDDAGDQGHGLEALIAWVRDQVQLARIGDVRVRAKLQLALGAGADGEVLKLREAYRERQTDDLARHLSAARAAKQIQRTLDPAETAAMLLGLVQGEQLRAVATGQTSGEAFIVLLERALAAHPATKPRRTSSKATPPADQKKLPF
jgi:AcrR family transcriptional regulator